MIYPATLSGIPLPTYEATSHNDALPPVRHQQAAASWDMLTANADITPEEVAKSDKIYLAAAFSPVYSYRSLGSGETSLSGYYNKSENAQISYSGGVNVGYQASKRLSIQTGLVYSRLGIQVSSVESLSSASADYNSPGSANSGSPEILFIGNSIGRVSTSMSNRVLLSPNTASADLRAEYANTPGSNLIKDQSAYRSAGVSLDQWFHFVEVPVMVKYKIIDRTVDFNLLGRTEHQHPPGQRCHHERHGGDKVHFGTTGDVRKLNYSGNIGLGMDVDLSRSLNFTFEPQFKYYLNSLNNHNLITSKPYYIGLYTGVRFEF